MIVTTALTPILSVPDAETAIQFYKDAFGATERSLHRIPGGAIHAEMAIGDAAFAVASEAPETGNLGPGALNGTSVRLNLIVSDPDALAERAVAAGASVMFPIADRPYGFRQGRIRDPFGHQWLIGRPLENA